MPTNEPVPGNIRPGTNSFSAELAQNAADELRAKLARAGVIPRGIYLAMDLMGLDITPPHLAGPSTATGREINTSDYVRFRSVSKGDATFDRDIAEFRNFINDPARSKAALYGVAEGVRSIGLLRYEGSEISYRYGTSDVKLHSGEVVGWVAYQPVPGMVAKGVEGGLTAKRRGEGSLDVFRSIRSYFPRYRAALELIDPESAKRSAGVGAILIAGVRPDLRGFGLGQALLHGAQQDLFNSGHRLAVSYARVPGFGKFMRSEFPAIASDTEKAPMLAAMSQYELHPYIDMTREDDGLSVDWGIRFHQRAGATLVCGAPGCANDTASMNNGAILVTDLVERCQP